MRRTRGGARQQARWWTLAFLVALAVVLVMRSNVAFLATQGISMEPRFHSGDLAVTLEQDDYQVGDIVAYRFEDQMVLHRIIEKTGGVYHFKGDNNSWVDPVRPTKGDLVGKLWFRLPKVGSLINLRGRSLQIGMIVVAALLIFGGKEVRRRRRRADQPNDEPRPKRPKLIPDGGDFAAATWLPGTAVLLSLVLAVVAFQRPVSTETTASRSYTQTVRYGYTASAPSGTTYPDGVVTTGSPIFLRLVSSLKFQLTYDVAAKAGLVTAAGGTYSIDAVVDGPAAWRRTIPLQAATPFTGQSFSTEVVVDIPQVRQIVAANAAETGIPADGVVVRIVPNVSTNGFIDGAPFATTFGKGLTMTVGPTTVALSTAGATTPAAGDSTGDMMPTDDTAAAGPTPDELTATDTAKYQAPVTKANRFELFGRRLDVGRARMLSGAFLLMSLIWLAVVAATQDRLRHRPESTRITHRYKDRIVDVTSLSDVDHVVDVAAVSALVKIAEQEERFILHLDDGDTDVFVVDDDKTRYRYVATGDEDEPVVGAGPEVTVADPTPSAPRPEPVAVATTPEHVTAPEPVIEPEPLPEPEPEPLPGPEPVVTAVVAVAEPAPTSDLPPPYVPPAPAADLPPPDPAAESPPPAVVEAPAPPGPPPFDPTSMPSPDAAREPSPPAGLVGASGDVPATPTVGDLGAFVDSFFPAHEATATPPPYLPADLPASLDDAIQLTPITEAEMQELGWSLGVASAGGDPAVGTDDGPVHGGGLG